MNQKSEIVNNAWNLMKQGNYKDALPILETSLNEDLSQNYFLASLLLDCYNKLGLYQKAIALGEELCSKENCWASIKQSYAWSLYFAYFKNSATLSPEEAIPILDKMALITDCNKKVNPLSLSIFSYLSQNKQITPELTIQLLDMLKFDLLDDKPVQLKKNGKTLASPKERFICYYTKALYMEKNYSRCIACCKRALELSSNSKRQTTFNDAQNKATTNADSNQAALFISSDNLIWIKRRLALSLYYLGEYDQAEEIMEQIIKKKKDWFLFYELSQIVYKKNEPEKALSYAAIASSTFGDAEMKIHLWDFLYQLLVETKNYPQAVKVLSLSAAIRFQKGWNISPSQKQELAKYNLIPEKLPPFKGILNELKPWFAEISYAENERLTGYIANLLPHNKAGFINSGKKSYYFKVSSCLFSPEFIVPNTKVSFIPESSYDPKKQKDSVIAVNIKRIE
jgi:tetratricopeptide (TPR) repeat protein